MRIADPHEDEHAKPVVTPASGGPVVGVLVGAYEPLVNARVCAYREGPHVDFVAADVEPICTTPTPAGRFELSLGPGVYNVVAAADHHLPGESAVVVRRAAPAPSVKLSLSPGGRAYVGRVVDLDGHPIPEAKVAHNYGVEVGVDAQGNYRLWSDRSRSLQARAPGFVADWPVGPIDERRLVLVPESVIAGVVLDRNVASSPTLASPSTGLMCTGRPGAGRTRPCGPTSTVASRSLDCVRLAARSASPRSRSLDATGPGGPRSASASASASRAWS